MRRSPALHRRALHPPPQCVCVCVCVCVCCIPPTSAAFAAMRLLETDLQVLTRELSLYLEIQVPAGLFGSGVGLSLVLGFTAAFACYYLNSIAKTPRTYCAANTEDLEAVIHHLHNMHASAPFMAAGVSMGGMLLLNYLGQTGRETPLMAAAIFSAGWNVFESAESLEKPLNWLLFNYYLTTCLQSSINRHRQMLEKLFDMNLVMKAKTIREFDKQFTSVMFGYCTVDDYYVDASPYRKLKSIGIPVLCLNSLDDVFSPGHAIPIETAKQNPNVALVLTSYGGHIGFLEGMWPRKCTYMDRVFKQFVQAVFEHGNKICSM
nr:phospholipase ABHD3 isoform X2 [Caretta caretta]